MIKFSLSPGLLSLLEQDTRIHVHSSCLYPQELFVSCRDTIPAEHKILVPLLDQVAYTLLSGFSVVFTVTDSHYYFALINSVPGRYNDLQLWQYRLFDNHGQPI